MREGGEGKNDILGIQWLSFLATVSHWKKYSFSLKGRKLNSEGILENK